MEREHRGCRVRVSGDLLLKLLGFDGQQCMGMFVVGAETRENDVVELTIVGMSDDLPVVDKDSAEYPLAVIECYKEITKTKIVPQALRESHRVAVHTERPYLRKPSTKDLPIIPNSKPIYTSQCIEIKPPARRWIWWA